MRSVLHFIGLLVMLIPVPGVAEESSGNVQFRDVWSRATPPGARNAVVYGYLENRGSSTQQLRSVTSVRAAHAMLHRSEISDDGRSRMVHLPSLTIGPGEEQILEPGGLHLMLMGIDGAFVPGMRIPLVLRFDSGEEVAAEASVGTMGQMEYPTGR